MNIVSERRSQQPIITDSKGITPIASTHSNAYSIVNAFAMPFACVVPCVQPRGAKRTFQPNGQRALSPSMHVARSCHIQQKCSIVNAKEISIQQGTLH